jgi:hypothetical protein
MATMMYGITSEVLDLKRLKKVVINEELTTCNNLFYCFAYLILNR